MVHTYNSVCTHMLHTCRPACIFTYTHTDTLAHIEYTHTHLQICCNTHMNMYSCSHAQENAVHRCMDWTCACITHASTHTSHSHTHTHMHTHTVPSGYNLTHTCVSDAYPKRGRSHMIITTINSFERQVHTCMYAHTTITPFMHDLDIACRKCVDLSQLYDTCICLLHL